MSQTDEDLEELPTDTESWSGTEPEAEGETSPEVSDQQPEGGREVEAVEKQTVGEQDVEEQKPKPTKDTDKKEVKAELDAESATGSVGEEGEEEQEEEVEEEEPSVYDSDDFISGPKLCKNGTLPLDILEFEYP